MLSQSSTFSIRNDGLHRDILITPLFLQNHKDPWGPNEIFDLTEWNGSPDESPSLGHIIIDDRLQWHYDGEGGLDDDELEKIAGFVLNGQ